MVDPTPIGAFRDRVARPAAPQTQGLEVRDFADAFEGNFFDMLGLELSDAPLEQTSSHEHSDDDVIDEENNPDVIHMSIADGCVAYVMQKVAALNPHFKPDTNEQEVLLLQNVNDFTKAGQTGFHRPITHAELNDMLHQCLMKTSVELCKTNIFPSPAIER